MPFNIATEFMSKFLISLFLGFSLVAPTVAQTKQELAMDLARSVVNMNLKAFMKFADSGYNDMKKRATVNGKLDRDMEIWLDEWKGVVNPETIARVMAEQWAPEFTVVELQKALEMVHSPIYKKISDGSRYLERPEMFYPIVKEICTRARLRVQGEGISTRDLDAMCAQFGS